MICSDVSQIQATNDVSTYCGDEGLLWSLARGDLVDCDLCKPALTDSVLNDDFFGLVDFVVPYFDEKLCVGRCCLENIVLSFRRVV